ncbi:MAG: hypothetical protein ACJAZO_000933 [Myxococcota bacterium]|jgi:hypothetical protein
MTTPADDTIAGRDTWLTAQPPLGRAMAQPMVEMVTDVLTAQQVMLDASVEQTQSLSDQVGGAWAANRTLEQKLHAIILG